MSIPIGRSDGKSVILYVDGHVATMLPGALADMRMWIDAADRRDFKFE